MSGKPKQDRAQDVGSRGKEGAKKKGRGNVDSIFWERLSKLVKIVLPDFTSKEARYIYLLTALLVVRTMLSIWLADVNGRVVKAIVNKSFKEFLRRVSHHPRPP